MHRKEEDQRGQGLNWSHDVGKGVLAFVPEMVQVLNCIELKEIPDVIKYLRSLKPSRIECFYSVTCLQSIRLINNPELCLQYVLMFMSRVVFLKLFYSFHVLVILLPVLGNVFRGVLKVSRVNYWGEINGKDCDQYFCQLSLENHVAHFQIIECKLVDESDKHQTIQWDCQPE